MMCVFQARKTPKVICGPLPCRKIACAILSFGQQGALLPLSVSMAQICRCASGQRRQHSPFGFCWLPAWSTCVGTSPCFYLALCVPFVVCLCICDTVLFSAHDVSRTHVFGFMRILLTDVTHPFKKATHRSFQILLSFICLKNICV